MQTPFGKIAKEAKKEARRIAEPGKRHRRDNGPQALEVTEAPPLRPDELGFTTFELQNSLGQSPKALAAAQSEAMRLSAKFGEEFEAEWLLETDWLQQLRATNRARVRYALAWRPRFLAAMALSRSWIISTKAARVAYNTVKAHRAADPTFDAQCLAAEAHATQLLLDRAFSLALEGNCEPVFWQGIRVGHVRKFDGKLLVEVLRAHAPAVYKAPGQASVKIQAGAGSQVLVIGAEERDALVALRQEALHRITERKAAAQALDR